MGQNALIRNVDLKRRILIVDDEAINRKILGHIVSRQYDVLYAENGKEALQIVREQQSMISLVLLDLLMPVMDGFELLGILHKDPEYKRIPVIVLTSDKSAEVRSLQLGAADFIPKPYDLPDVILARIRRSIELAEDNRLLKATETDALTGLYNKEFFFQYAGRYDLLLPDTAMDAIIYTINRMRAINALHGREGGDEVLKNIAAHLKEYALKNSGIVCRHGGDSFYLYVEHKADNRAALEALTQTITGDLAAYHGTVRAGVYENADPSLTMEQRFDRARQALSGLREGYVSEIAYYDSGMHEKELFHERLIGEMDQALKEKQFKVYFQPKYAIRGDRARLVSAEALVRWIHPELGVVSPGTFIPLFEQNGLILKLDRYIWNEAAAQLGAWQKETGFPLSVSVNLSRIDLYEPGLCEEFSGIVRKHGLDPKHYYLEVTESAYMDAPRQLLDTIRGLRDRGFRIEMDDFGAGYSSLHTLTNLPVDVLKLDMGFVRNITTSQTDLRVVKLMIDLAGLMDLPTVAEGVETKEQLDLLKEAGCSIVQGYYFSKPVPAEEFVLLIRKELEESAKETVAK